VCVCVYSWYASFKLCAISVRLFILGELDSDMNAFFESFSVLRWIKLGTGWLAIDWMTTGSCLRSAISQASV